LNSLSKLNCFAARYNQLRSNLLAYLGAFWRALICNSRCLLLAGFIPARDPSIPWLLSLIASILWLASLIFWIPLLLLNQRLKRLNRREL
jgi:hypothetical protein